MRITYRNLDNKAYWTARWTSIPADPPMENRDAYPLRYAERTILNRTGRILEAGCGAGRILRYYHARGHDIVGFDFIPEAIEKLHAIDPTLQLDVADVTHLPYPDGSFRYILAFGLYHNIEHERARALAETARALEPGGWLCVSFRADNIQTRLTDWFTEHRAHRTLRSTGARVFHKANFTRRECVSLIEGSGLLVREVHSVENMPILYKFACFRSRTHRAFDEAQGREEGYQLSHIGRMLQWGLMRLAPRQFCNLFVCVAQKPFTPDARTLH